MERQDSHDLILHENTGYSTRSNRPNLIFSNERIPPIDQLGVKDLTVVDININPNAKVFADYVQSKSIQVIQKNINQFNTPRSQGALKEIKTLKVDEIINIIHQDLGLGYETDIDTPSSSKKRKLGNNVQDKAVNIQIQKLLSEGLSPVRGFISSESDIQIILQGLFIGQKYQQYHIKVFSEISYGHGRADLTLFFVDNQFTEAKPIIFELKYKQNINGYRSAYVNSKFQLVEYINFLKSSTEYN